MEDMEAATQVRQTMIIAAVVLIPTGGGHEDENFEGTTRVSTDQNKEDS